MPTSVSRRLNIPCIMFKIIMFFYDNARLYATFCILLIFGKLLLDRIILPGGEVGPSKLVKLCHFLFICLFQVRKASGHAFVCWCIHFASYYGFCFIEFWNCSTISVFFLFIADSICNSNTQQIRLS